MSEYHLKPAFQNRNWKQLTVGEKFVVVALFLPSALVLSFLQVMVWLDIRF